MDVKADHGGKAQACLPAGRGQGARRLLHLASGIRHPASCIRHHSYLSASIGFNLAALSAG